MSWIRVFVCIVALILCGCPSKPSSSTTQEKADDQPLKVNGPLRVLILDDPEFGQLIQREWAAQSEYEIAVNDQSTTDSLRQVRDGSATLDTDVVVFPSPLLGELADDGLLRALPSALTTSNAESDENAFRIDEVFSVVARKELQWDRRQLAISLGSPVPLLLTRGDLVSEPPQTWTELQATINSIKSSLPDNVEAFVQPLAEDWAARVFLSRVAPYLYQSSRVSSFFDYSSMKPRITSGPFVRALSEMKEQYVEDHASLNPADAFEHFTAGKAAMAICWPQNSITATEPSTFPIVINELPGVTEEYDHRNEKWIAIEEETPRRVTVAGHEGRLAAISRSAKNARLAGIFLAWIGGGKQSSLLCPRSNSSAPFRQSHLSSAKNWCDTRLTGAASAQYGTVLESALSRPESYVSIRVPHHDKYMQELDQFVLKALRGELSPKEALEKTSESWEQITDARGRENQIKAYRHSLGISIE